MLSVSDVSILLITEVNTVLLCVSDHRISALEDLQFTLGEGPSFDAFSSGEPVCHSQLAVALPDRWPALASLVVDAGVEGVFAFPLQIGAARIGVLTLYQRRAGALTREQYSDALVVADVLAHLILSVQANAPPGALAEQLGDAGAYRAEIHQASGMLSEQIQVSIADALVRLRRQAYETHRPIAEVAADVIARRLRITRPEAINIAWAEET